MKKLFLLLLLAVGSGSLAQSVESESNGDELKVLGLANAPENYTVKRKSNPYKITDNATGYFYVINDNKAFGFSELHVLQSDRNAWQLRLFDRRLVDVKFAVQPKLVFIVKDDLLGDTVEGFIFPEGPLKNVFLTRKNEGKSEGYPEFATAGYLIRIANDPQKKDWLYDELFEYMWAPFYFYWKNKTDFCKKSFVKCVE